MGVYNPRNPGRRLSIIRKPQDCDGCGRRLPRGSAMLIWTIWHRGLKHRFRFCSDCQHVIYGCQERPPMDIWNREWQVRDMCERCDGFPFCKKVEYLKKTAPGDLMLGDVPIP